MYATYQVSNNRIYLDYISSKGENMLGEVIHLRPNFRGDPQEIAYRYASVRALSHNTTLQALRAA